VNAERQRVVAEKLGHAGGRACDAMRAFVKSLALPTRLSDIGITVDRIAELAAQYNGTGPISTNPRPVRGAADLAEILKLAA
jgi:alcohol dehydrogenase class IV